MAMTLTFLCALLALILAAVAGFLNHTRLAAGAAALVALALLLANVRAG